MLDKELEAELRAAINPLHADIKGSGSYERKRLLGEIDGLRKLLLSAADLLEYASLKQGDEEKKIIDSAGFYHAAKKIRNLFPK